jgi:hypothetical protein
LEETEVLFDTLASDVQSKIALVDTNAFNSQYPKQRRALELGVSADHKVYINYAKRYQIKREEAKLRWRIDKMGSAGVVNRAIRRKLDSLQALPHQVSLVPTKVEPIYDENYCEEVVVEAPKDSLAKDSATTADSTVAKADSVASVEKAKPKTEWRCKIKEVRLFFGKEGDRYDVSWSGTVEDYSPDDFFKLLTSGASVRAFISIEKNKPVWIYNQGVLTGRHHYQYVKFSVSANNKELKSHGGFELPQYIFDQPEVQEWLNRPAEVKTHKVQEQKTKVKVEDGGSILDMAPRIPRVVRDRERGNIALIDSGSFRYKGKVVALSPFAIQTTEVTQQLFADVMNKQDSSSRIKDRSIFKGPRHPVHNINWHDAQKFCQAIGGDLPTEAQWEFAGRADNNEGAVWTMDEDPNPGLYAIYKANSYSLGKKNPAYGPQPVSTKKSNAWGIFDMSGNVAEWTRDKYFMFSVWIEDSNPSGAMMGSTRVYKGGSWRDKESLLNLTERDDEDPRYWSDWIGFRCAFPRSLFEGDNGK